MDEMKEDNLLIDTKKEILNNRIPFSGELGILILCISKYIKILIYLIFRVLKMFLTLRYFLNIIVYHKKWL